MTTPRPHPPARRPTAPPASSPRLPASPPTPMPPHVIDALAAAAEGLRSARQTQQAVAELEAADAGRDLAAVALEAKASQQLSERLLAIHDYRAAKQTDILANMVRGAGAAERRVAHLDKFARKAGEAQAEAAKPARGNEAVTRTAGGFPGEEPYHGLFRQKKLDTRSVVERVETLRAQMLDMAATVEHCLGRKDNDERIIRNLRATLRSSQNKATMLQGKLDTVRGRAGGSERKLAALQEQVERLHATVKERDGEIVRLQSKAARAEAWSSRSDTVRDTLFKAEQRNDVLQLQNAQLEMQLAKAKLAQERGGGGGGGNGGSGGGDPEFLQKAFERRILALRKDKDKDILRMRRRVSEQAGEFDAERVEWVRREAELVMHGNAAARERDAGAKRILDLERELTQARNQLDNYEHEHKYKKMGGAFLKAVRAKQAAAKAAQEAAALAAEREAARRKRAEEDAEWEAEQEAAAAERLRKRQLAEEQRRVEELGGGGFEPGRRRQRENDEVSEEDSEDSLFGAGGERTGGYDYLRKGVGWGGTAGGAHGTCMLTRPVQPLGRLGPSEMYVQAMAYFRPATERPAVARVQKLLAERISKAVAQREKRVKMAWGYFVKMYTTYRTWKAISHTPCTVGTLMALQQAKLDARATKRAWRGMRLKQRSNRIWNSICDGAVQLANECNAIVGTVAPSQSDTVAEVGVTADGGGAGGASRVGSPPQATTPRATTPRLPHKGGGARKAPEVARLPGTSFGPGFFHTGLSTLRRPASARARQRAMRQAAGIVRRPHVQQHKGPETALDAVQITLRPDGFHFDPRQVYKKSTGKQVRKPLRTVKPVAAPTVRDRRPKRPASARLRTRVGRRTRL